MSRRDVVVKFNVIGDAGIGKSLLVDRYVTGRFAGADDEKAAGGGDSKQSGVQYHMTIGAEFRVVTLKNIPDLRTGQVRNVKLQLWDCGGQERFHSVTRAYYRGSDGIFICFDLTNRISFANVAPWHARVLEMVSGSSLSVYLIGLKSDAVNDRVVAAAEARQLATDLRMDAYYEVSALTGAHVAEPFFHAAIQALRFGERFTEEGMARQLRQSGAIKLSEPNGESSKGGACCDGGGPYRSSRSPDDELPSVTAADKAGVDDVFADMEQSVQSVAGTVLWCVPSWDDMYLDEVLINFFCCSCRCAMAVVTFALLAVALVLVFLPAIFLLLMVRTTHVEHDTKAMDVRAAVMEQESECQKCVRKLSFIVKAFIPLFIFFVWPLVIVLQLLSTDAPSSDLKDRAQGLIGVQLLVIAGFQLLGTVRAGVSWWESLKRKSTNPPTASDAAATATAASAVKQRKKPRAFAWKSGAGAIAIATLSLEFFQTATFSLQRISTEPVPEPPATDASVQPQQLASGWAPKLFSAVFLTVLENSSLALIWVSIGAVVLLVALFAMIFMHELRAYGRLVDDKHRQPNKKRANDRFFFGFVGSVIYGHAAPKYVNRKLKALIAILTDSLFFVICFRLLTALQCNYDLSVPTLVSVPNVVCWQRGGSHPVMAACALVGFCYYVPLCTMIAPLFMTADPDDDDGTDDEPSNAGASTGTESAEKQNDLSTKLAVAGNSSDESESPVGVAVDEPQPKALTYVKVYVMCQTALKTCLLIVTSFLIGGGGSATADVVMSLVASTTLLIVTAHWVSVLVAKGAPNPNPPSLSLPTQAAQAPPSELSSSERQQNQPCAVTEVNFVKISSYAAGVWGSICGIAMLSVPVDRRAAVMNYLLPIGCVLLLILTAVWYRRVQRRFAPVYQYEFAAKIAAAKAQAKADADAAASRELSKSSGSGRHHAASAGARVAHVTPAGNHSTEFKESAGAVVSIADSQLALYRAGGGDGVCPPCAGCAFCRTPPDTRELKDVFAELDHDAITAADAARAYHAFWNDTRPPVPYASNERVNAQSQAQAHAALGVGVGGGTVELRAIVPHSAVVAHSSFGSAAIEITRGPPNF